MLGRIKNRWGILLAIYDRLSNKNIFAFDNNCTIPIIREKLRGLSCKKTPILQPTVTVTEPESITEVPGPEGDLLKTRASEDGEDPLGAEDLGSLPVELDLNEDSHTEPKLDTTYAAASLAGISLFGTILYKVKCHYINEILCTCFIFNVSITLI
ncbi:hypothetical protein PVBG_06037 [Plasmodium vivax Brazil I]|uniref:Uncharacterized protein n=1 Tax=Plasmodium vivax (strain Brazil I) TaxID=1033975 RepID=A0A0J9SK47_PLAV1|nr:hypothetical protein PVBG_06037 [Plasmodium vivax Brazil I]